MITVCGETVADLVGLDNGDLRPFPGGSPANVAVALARLGTPASLLARLGPDVFGRRMHEHLERNGVGTELVVRAAEPSTLAVVSFDEARRASYDFWVDGTADWQWSDGDLAAHPTPGSVAVHTGSIASWTPPGDGALVRAFARMRESGRVTLSYDPNVRPRLLADAAHGRSLIERFVHLAHVVKVSDEDLAWLYPGEPPPSVARRWAELGADLVVVTLGPDGALARLRGLEVSRPAPVVELADTVGAGDTFMGGLLHALERHDALGADPVERLARLDEAALGDVLELAVTAAALNCTRPGADPPTRDELYAALGRPA